LPDADISLVVIATLTLAVGRPRRWAACSSTRWNRSGSPSEQLVALSALEPRANVEGYFYADTFKAYRAAQRSFAEMSMYSGGAILRVEAQSGVFEDAVTEAVSPSYFDLVGARPSAGRFFSESDDAVVVISEGYRRRVFGNGPGIGETIKINGVPATVIGVAAPGFDGLHFDGPFDIIVPVAVMQPAAGAPSKPCRSKDLVGVSRAACPSTRRARSCSRAGRRFSRRRCRPRCLNPSGKRCSVSGWTWHRSRRAFRLSAPGTAPRSGCSWA
jgi:hypothetical protein